MTENPTPLSQWHQIIKSADGRALNHLLAEDAVFHSPVVWTPQEGKRLVQLYLTAAMHVLDMSKFHYVREVSNGTDAVLEFRTEIDGIAVEGVDMIRFNQEGKIEDFKVMLRPLKAVNIVQQKMGELLLKMKQS